MEVTVTKGMPCTVHVGSDKYPAKVIDITPSGKTVTITMLEDLNTVHKVRKDSQGTWRLYAESPRWKVAFGKAIYELDKSF